MTKMENLKPSEQINEYLKDYKGKKTLLFKSGEKIKIDSSNLIKLLQNIIEKNDQIQIIGDDAKNIMFIRYSEIAGIY
tara:strand:- start:15070 stop:15303 length:234 start_codon:yes stop_codon:yes gene_type:complete